jgi:vacuolar-type H+-ATPase subunit H
MRFRRIGPPGRAAPGGVPADRSAELVAELMPPLSLLDQAEAQARSIREQAARTAAGRRGEAERRAEEIVALAHSRAAGVRARSADRVRRAVEAEAAGILASAEREAAEIRHRAQTRMPLLLDHVSALVIEGMSEHRGQPREGSPRWAPDG